jgi:autotransporter strand-loop-strand O-heptosyltransferase
MAHKEQREFCKSVKDKFPEYFKNKKVLDIGSLNINGCNRDLFENCDYTGIDVGEGPNVDIVSVGHIFNAPDETFDVIISTEVFEHDMFYVKTIENVMRMLKPDGLFLFTCAAPGRPEHGTRRKGEDCAPLLKQISEDWADYYKNLTPEDFREIPNFNDTFVNEYFEVKDTDIEIPSDLYFYGFKKYKPKYSQFTEDAFVVDCWTDTKEKEDVLKQLLNKLKVYGAPIILCGHYAVNPEIMKMADYFLFIKDNDLLYEKDFVEYGVNSDRWTDMGTYKVINKNNYHHDYAIWCTMKQAFKLVESLGKKFIHFLEYDNLPDEIQYRQSFMEYVRNNDAVVYEYDNKSTQDKNPYSATYIFSIKTNIANQLISKINTKEEFFKNKPDAWQLEKNFYQRLREVTGSIFVSKYIPNNNELNIFAAWNRNGILKGNAKIQNYLAVDDANQIYLHIISGFHNNPTNQDYLIEINYKDHKKFLTVEKNKYYLEKLGNYKKGEIVEVFYQGINIFTQELDVDVKDFRKKNRLIKKATNTNRRTNIHFVDGPYVEILEDGDYLYNVQFIDKKNGKLEFEFNLKSNHWVRSSKKYYVDWLIKIKGIDNNFYEEHNFDLTDKRVMICFESKSLGDSLAWIPYVEKFRVDNKCKVICSSFNNDLFKDQYPEIEFVLPGSSVNNIHALYRLGLFYTNERKIDVFRHYNDPKKEPLMKVASDILGLDYVELRPKLKKLGKKKKKIVSIAIHSTSQCKYWNNSTGWQEVVDYLKAKNYEVRLLSREEDGYMGNKHPKGITVQPQSKLTEIIKVLQESELFIGISSGLSWLAWASGTPTVIISGFTDVDLEPLDGITRIINKEVCNSCWSNHDFDPGNWNWCPIHEKTERQFECSKTITGKEVINKIEKLLPI